MSVGELHRPIAAERPARRRAALRVEVIARAQPVEDRRPLALGIGAGPDGRLADAGHVDEQHGVAACAQEGSQSSVHLLLPGVDPGPHHDHGRPVGPAGGAGEVERDVVSLLGPARERDGDHFERRVLELRRGDEQLAGPVVHPLLERVIGRGVAAQERRPVGLHEGVAPLHGAAGPLRGGGMTIRQLTPGGGPGLGFEALQLRDRRPSSLGVQAVERMDAALEAREQPGPPVLEVTPLGHASRMASTRDSPARAPVGTREGRSSFSRPCHSPLRTRTLIRV